MIDQLKIIESKRSLNVDDLDAVERRAGITLPDDLREFYLLANGGIPIPDSYEKDGEYFTVSFFLPLLGEGQGFEEALRLLRSDERSPVDVIPFADDLNGDLFVYSVSPSTFGQVLFIQGDYFDDPDRFLISLAPSLKSFLSALVKHPED